MLPDCAIEIADYYDVPVALVESVREQEGGKVGEINGPRYNGSYDIGPMQINTWWIDKLQDVNISFDEVRDNYCTNLAVGTWILRMEYEHFGNWFQALAAYNAGAGRVSYGEKYARKVIQRWNVKYIQYNNAGEKK